MGGYNTTDPALSGAGLSRLVAEHRAASSSSAGRISSVAERRIGGARLVCPQCRSAVYPASPTRASCTSSTAPARRRRSATPTASPTPTSGVTRARSTRSHRLLRGHERIRQQGARPAWRQARQGDGPDRPDEHTQPDRLRGPAASSTRSRSRCRRIGTSRSRRATSSSLRRCSKLSTGGVDRELAVSAPSRAGFTGHDPASALPRRVLDAVGFSLVAHPAEGVKGLIRNDGAVLFVRHTTGPTSGSSPGAASTATSCRPRRSPASCARSSASRSRTQCRSAPQRSRQYATTASPSSRSTSRVATCRPTRSRSQRSAGRTNRPPRPLGWYAADVLRRARAQL